MIRRFAAHWLCACICLVPFAVGCGETASPPTRGAWYKGDLHCHSTHSDGDGSVAEVIARAESIGLDFFVITDHDGSMGGSPSQWYDPDYRSEEMVILYGAEWTTGRGHANLWASHPFDYEDLWEANRFQDVRTAIDAAHAQGALFSINHPSAFLCCPWEYEDDADADSVEVWNAMYRLPNFNAVSTHRFWDDRLLSGQRVTGLGGSDTHQLKGFEANFLRHGEPTTWVFAERLSPGGLLAAIKAGHVSVSDAPAGPRLGFSADTDGDGAFDAMMGDSVLLETPTEVTLRFRIEKEETPAGTGTVVEIVAGMAPSRDSWNGKTMRNEAATLLDPDAYLALLIKNGRLHGLWKMAGNGAQVTFTETVTPDEQVYYRVELLGKPVEDPVNRLLRGFTKALSNPIYFGYAQGSAEGSRGALHER